MLIVNYFFGLWSLEEGVVYCDLLGLGRFFQRIEQGFDKGVGVFCMDEVGDCLVGRGDSVYKVMEV